MPDFGQPGHTPVSVRALRRGEVPEPVVTEVARRDFLDRASQAHRVVLADRYLQLTAGHRHRQSPIDEALAMACGRGGAARRTRSERVARAALPDSDTDAVAREHLGELHVRS